MPTDTRSDCELLDEFVACMDTYAELDARIAALHARTRGPCAELRRRGLLDNNNRYTDKALATMLAPTSVAD